MALPRLVPAGGGGGGGRHYASGYWLTPVPLAGDLTVVCSWAAYGIEEARLVFPAAAITRAAGRAVELWPWEPAVEPAAVPEPEPPARGWFARRRDAGPGTAADTD